VSLELVPRGIIDKGRAVWLKSDGKITICILGLNELYEKILESRASEHSARMVAMKSATDNAKQLVKDLTLEYNKARQAAITNVILEISSAAATMS